MKLFNAAVYPVDGAITQNTIQYTIVTRAVRNVRTLSHE